MAISCCITTRVKDQCCSCYDLYRRRKKRAIVISLLKLLSSLVFMICKSLSLVLGLITKTIRFPSNLLLHHKETLLISIFSELGSGIKGIADRVVSKMALLLMTIPERIVRIVNFVVVGFKFIINVFSSKDQNDGLKELTPLKSVAVGQGGRTQEKRIIDFLVNVFMFVAGMLERFAGNVWKSITVTFRKIPLRLSKLLHIISYLETIMACILRQILSGSQVILENAEIIFSEVKEKMTLSTTFIFEALTRNLSDHLIPAFLDLINETQEIVTIWYLNQIETVVMFSWNVGIALKSLTETTLLFFQYERELMENSFHAVRSSSSILCSHAVVVCNDLQVNISAAIEKFVGGLHISAVKSFGYCSEIFTVFLESGKEYIESTKATAMSRLQQVHTCCCWALKVSKEPSDDSWRDDVAVLGLGLFLIFIVWSIRRRVLATTS